MKLSGKVAIVTGSSKGIGRAIALLYAKEGAKVTVSARSRDQVEQVAEKIRELGGEALAVQADVTSEVDVARLVNTTFQTWGQIDILVNNAATILPRIDVVDIEPDQWRRVIDVNLTGSFLCARAVLPHMIKRKTGKIINISSMGGRKGARGRGPYCASKAALINFSETLAAEAYDHGIDVNCICPGGVDTEMIRVTRGNQASGLMRPEEIAAVALFLASDESSSITGTAIDAAGPSHKLFQVG